MCQCPKSKKCKVSTHIGNDLTCGWGKLDYNGFWEHGCYECARDLEKKLVDKGFPSQNVWPYSKEYLDSIKKEN